MKIFSRKTHSPSLEPIPSRPGRPTGAIPLWPQLAVAESQLLALPIPERFHHYQATVRRLLEHGLARFDVRSEIYRTPRGQFRRLAFLARLDTEIEQIRKALTESAPAMALLRQFDAIRGILLDLWT